MGLDRRLAVKTFAALGLLALSTSAVAQQLPGAHGPESRIDCPQLDVAYVPPVDQLRWPTHIDQRIPDPFGVNVRCEVISGGLLRNCAARPLQEHGLRDLGFIERYVSRITVSDEPRPCGQTTLTLATPVPPTEG